MGEQSRRSQPKLCVFTDLVPFCSGDDSYEMLSDIDGLVVTLFFSSLCLTQQ